MPKLNADRLGYLSTFTSTKKTQIELEEARPLAPNFDVLDLELDPFMQKNLQYLLDCTELQQQEQYSHQYWKKAVAREQAKMQSWLTARVRIFFYVVKERGEKITDLYTIETRKC